VTGVSVFCAIAEKLTKQKPSIAQARKADTPFMTASRSNIVTNELR
jgi:hypothetical protein